MKDFDIFSQIYCKILKQNFFAGNFIANFSSKSGFFFSKFEISQKVRFGSSSTFGSSVRLEFEKKVGSNTSLFPTFLHFWLSHFFNFFLAARGRGRRADELRRPGSRFQTALCCQNSLSVGEGEREREREK